MQHPYAWCVHIYYAASICLMCPYLLCSIHMLDMSIFTIQHPYAWCAYIYYAASICFMCPYLRCSIHMLDVSIFPMHSIHINGLAFRGDSTFQIVASAWKWRIYFAEFHYGQFLFQKKVSDRCYLMYCFLFVNMFNIHALQNEWEIGWIWWNVSFVIYSYRQVSNIRCTKSQHLKDSRTVLRLSLPNPLKPDVKLRMKM